MSDLFPGPLSVEDPAAEPPRRSRTHHARKRRTERRRRLAIILVVVLAMLAAAGYMVAKTFDSFSQGDSGVTDYPGPGTVEVQVVVNPGDSGAAIATTLLDSGVVATRKAFLDALAQSTSSAQIQAGTYNLRQEMRAVDALAALLDRGSRVEWKVTVPEGLRVGQVVDRLVGVTGVPVADVEAAMADTAATGLPAEAGGSYEGWLAPATYAFPPGTAATEMLRQMVAKTTDDLTARGIAREDWLTVLTKASIVEKEISRAEDRPKAARVIENRLAIGKPLEMDSTVHFIVGASEDATTTQEDRSSDNPYNTYRFPGLPPGPISSPGAGAIDAVLDPEPGDWMFFVTVDLDTGETLFADTYTEHLENSKRLQEWLRNNQ